MSSFRCAECNQLLSSSSSLQRHTAKFHRAGNCSSPSRPPTRMKCGVCSEVFSKYKNLERHIKNEHDVRSEHEHQSFESQKDFKTWLQSVEEKDRCKYVRRNMRKNSDGTTVIYYRCNRSGSARTPVAEETRKREVKIQGSVKSGFQCPARITSWISASGAVKIDFCRTHAFHAKELKHLPLPSPKKKEIAAKIAAKVPFQEILFEVEECAKSMNTTTDELARIHLVDMQDLRNIVRDFRLDSDKRLHPDDATSVDAWAAKEMSLGEDSCIIIYKPRGKLSENHDFITEGDFLLGIMTPAQQEIMKKFGKDGIICMDSTHGTNNYNYQLTTLMVHDDLRQGFPVAFFFSNIHDAPFLEVFLSSVKEKVGLVQCKTFMSDMADNFYNAWEKVMGRCEFRLYCTWHVVKAWHQKLLKTVKSETKRTAAYKQLYTLLTLTEEESFKIMLPAVIRSLKEDPETSDFAAYFVEYYSKKCQRWAYCYRVNSGINTNMSLERLHQSIKHIFMKGKVGTRLDATIHALTRLIDRKVFDRIIFLEKGKLTYKMRELRSRHKKAISNFSKFQDKVLPDGETGQKWIVPSFETNEQYSVAHVQTESCCQLQCKSCNACVHQYTCTCRDFCIKSNMCKHVHLVVQLLLCNSTGETDPEMMALDDVLSKELEHPSTKNDDSCGSQVGDTEPEKIASIDVPSDKGEVGFLQSGKNASLDHLLNEDASREDEDSRSLQVVEIGNEESKVLLTCISRDKNNAGNKNLEDLKRSVGCEMMSLLSKIQTVEGVLTFKKSMRNVIPILQASENLQTHSFEKGPLMSANKRIEPQRKFPAKKKKKKISMRMKKPSPGEMEKLAIAAVISSKQQQLNETVM